MPRFTLRDLFWCVTLIGLGLAALYNAFMTEWEIHGTAILIVIAFFASGPLIGAGVGTLYHRKGAGAGIGLLVVCAAGLMHMASSLR